jgi:hypothetical protein
MATNVEHGDPKDDPETAKIIVRQN